MATLFIDPQMVQSETYLRERIQEVVAEMLRLKETGASNPAETARLVAERGAVLSNLILALDVVYKRQRLLLTAGWIGLAAVSLLAIWKNR